MVLITKFVVNMTQNQFEPDTFPLTRNHTEILRTFNSHMCVKED